MTHCALRTAGEAGEGGCSKGGVAISAWTATSMTRAVMETAAWRPSSIHPWMDDELMALFYDTYFD